MCVGPSLRTGMMPRNSSSMVPITTHCFDYEGYKGEWEGRIQEYNPAAAADSIEQARLFLAKYLGK